MFTERQNKVSKLIQKDISEIFVKHGKAWFGSAMVTVTIVRITKDLSIAKIYISVFPSSKADEIIELLNFNVKKVRYELGNRIRHQLKNVPELHFYKDDSLDHIEKIDKLLNG
ncbi:MAG: 30S ribosome-binding factor RbfA [Bacteroidota bacterium]|nr:30S ribosome-binding factor RbfA [Bacteroidota bacterium]